MAGSATSIQELESKVKALIDDGIKGVLRSLGDAGAAPANAAGETLLSYLKENRTREEFKRKLITSRSRTGKVIWQTDFDTALELVAGDVSTGSIARDTTVSQMFRGSAFLKLTTGALSGNEQEAVRIFGLTKNSITAGGKIGLELYFAISSNNTYFVTISLGRWTAGSNQTIGRLKFDVINKKWQYLNSAGTYVDVTGGAQELDRGTYSYNHFKMTIAPQDGKYGKMWCNGLEINMSTIDLRTEATGLVTTIKAYIRCATGVAAAATLSVDDMMITDEEE